MYKLHFPPVFKKAKQFFLLVILISAVAACKKGSQADPTVIPGAVPYVQGSGLYIAGIASVGDSSGVAVVWHNGAITALGPAKSYAYNITSQGSDVYIGGRSGANVVYWKNGVVSAPSLSQSLNGLQLTGIAVQGSDVYQSGYIYNSVSPTPVYWKNGLFNNLAYTSKKYLYGLQTAGIIVANSDLYFLGQGLFYWKNNQFVEINYSNTSSVLWSATTVSGTDVYVAGETPLSLSTYLGYSLAYWKNGTYNFIANTKLIVNNMAVHGNDIYIAGNMTTTTAYNEVQGAYYKNGILTTLPIPSGYARATVNSIYIDTNNNVYLTGAAYDSNDTPYPVYWNNGVATVLGAAHAYAGGIVNVP